MRIFAAVAICLLSLPMLAADGGLDRSSSASGNGGSASSRSSESVSTQATVIKLDEPGSSGTNAGDLERAAGKDKSDNGLQGRSIGRQAGHYFLSRWYDLVDVVDFSVGGGPGFMFNVHATKLAQVGGGYSDAYRVGFRGRSAGLWRERRHEIGVSLLYYQKIRRESVTGWVESFRSDTMDLDTAEIYANNNDRSFLGVGATVHALVLVDVNVRPMQAVDWALGWFTIDVLDDDTGKPKRNKDL